MKTKRLGLLLLTPLVFSCANGANIPLNSEAYVVTMKSSHNEFNILQLTDIHWSYNTQIDEASKFLTAIVDAAKKDKGHIDLIEITGDSLFIANKFIAAKLYETVNSWDIPFAFTCGNHDYQGHWSADWLNELVSAGSNALFPYSATKHDNVSGETNYVINVQWNNKDTWQLYHLDTKNLINSGGSYDYDYIRDDQVEWYKAQTDASKAKNGKYLPSITYCHIPTIEIYDYSKTTPVGGVVQEDDPYFFPGNHPSDYLEVALERNMKGMFFGHDHSNDAVWKYKDALLGYGVKANYELYYTSDKDTNKTLTGGAIVSLKQDETYTLKHFYIDEIGSSKETYKSWEVTL